VANNQLLIDN